MGARLRIPLDGDDWRCKAYLGEEWRFRRAYAGDSRDVHGWVPARVPGSVVADLVRAGVVDDPLVDRNSLATEWVAERAWVYRREVTLPDVLDDRRVVVGFEGLDPAGEIFWNGASAGVHDGMFVPAVRDITDLATPCRNVVAVVLAPAPVGEPQVGRTERVRTTKSRMSYGWDFCPRLIHVGVWDHAWIDVIDGVRIADVGVRTHLTAELDHARVEWSVDVEADERPAVEVTVSLDGRPVDPPQVVEAASGVATVSGVLELAQPALWWPNGHGAQPRYLLQVRARTAGGGGDGQGRFAAGGSDAREVAFGLRRVEVRPNDDAPADARPYTVVVNGRPIYLTGWNWVPMDVHHGVRDPDRLEHLLALAADAHVTLLRVWGGGLVETEEFYDACDRHGIMVWQEFPLSSSGISSVPSDDAGYVALLRATAEQSLPRRGHHPSLVLWCGGNELDGPDGLPLDDRGRDRGGPAIAALADVVARLAPDRVWLPTSPTGPTATCTLEAIERQPDGLHDVHGPWEHQGLEGQRTLYDRSTALLHSEFGVEGMTNLATLDAFVSPRHRWPADRSNPVWVHRGDWWINTPLVEECFGGILGDLETLCRASQFLQAEGLRYAVEANRRRQWRCSGTLPWQFDESFPTGFCTSAVDYRGRPKAVYHDVAAAYRPLQTSAAFATTAWGGRDLLTAEVSVSTGRDALDDRLEAALLSADGGRHQVHAWAVVAPAESSRHVATYTVALDSLPADGPPVLWLDLRLAAHPQADSRYVLSRTTDLAPLLALPPATLDVTVEADSLEVCNHGDVAALLVSAVDARPVTARGYLRVRGGNRTLMPGECCTLPFAWTGAPAHDRRIAVTGWNVPTVEVEAGDG